MKIYEFDIKRCVTEYLQEHSPLRTHKYFTVIYPGKPKVYAYILVSDNEKPPIKYQYKNKWFCLYKEVLNFGTGIKDVKVENAYNVPGAQEIPTWIGFYDVKSGVFLKNHYYDNQELINFIISKL